MGVREGLQCEGEAKGWTAPRNRAASHRCAVIPSAQPVQGRRRARARCIGAVSAFDAVRSGESESADGARPSQAAEKLWPHTCADRRGRRLSEAERDEAVHQLRPNGRVGLGYAAEAPRSAGRGGAGLGRVGAGAPGPALVAQRAAEEGRRLVRTGLQAGYPGLQLGLHRVAGAEVGHERRLSLDPVERGVRQRVTVRQDLGRTTADAWMLGGACSLISVSVSCRARLRVRLRPRHRRWRRRRRR